MVTLEMTEIQKISVLLNRGDGHKNYKRDNMEVVCKEISKLLVKCVNLLYNLSCDLFGHRAPEKDKNYHTCKV